MVNKQPNSILLTGAGFTHNLGGYLASDLWAQIFNHRAVQRFPEVRKAMQEDEVRFNFEEIYDRVTYGEHFTAEQKEAMAEAVRSAYRDLDDIIRGFRETDRSMSFNAVARFVERFAGTQKNPGFVFTLNQDLFVERRIPFQKLVALPGLPKGGGFSTAFNSVPIEDIQIRLPNNVQVQNPEPEFPAELADLSYVKLHGSMDWLSHIAAKLIL